MSGQWTYRRLVGCVMIDEPGRPSAIRLADEHSSMNDLEARAAAICREHNAHEALVDAANEVEAAIQGLALDPALEEATDKLYAALALAEKGGEA